MQFYNFRSFALNHITEPLQIPLQIPNLQNTNDFNFGSALLKSAKKIPAAYPLIIDPNQELQTALFKRSNETPPLGFCADNNCQIYIITLIIKELALLFLKINQQNASVSRRSLMAMLIMLQCSPFR